MKNIVSRTLITVGVVGNAAILMTTPNWVSAKTSTQIQQVAQTEQQNSNDPIKSLTAKIATDPENDMLYVERGILYTWSGKFIGPNIKYELIGSEIDKNRANALADAAKAIKINPRNYRAFHLRGIVTASYGKGNNKDFEQAAKLKSESKIVANIYNVDFSSSRQINPSDLQKNIPASVVIKGDKRTSINFDSLTAAKEFSRKNKQANVIILDKENQRFYLYQAIITENTSINLKVAETPFHNSLRGKSIIPLTYTSLKTNMNLSLMLLPRDEIDRLNVWSEVVDVVDDKGLSLVKKLMMGIVRGSKGIRLLMDSELSNGNFDEAMEIYQYLEKLNINSNDLDIVKVTRKTNLSKIYRTVERLRPFVEKEMEKYKYAEADRIAVRGK